jgi:hypothetical protein
MLFTTVIGLFIVPSLYIMIKGLESYVRGDKDKGDRDGSDKINNSRNTYDPDHKQSEVGTTTHYKLDQSGQNS